MTQAEEMRQQRNNEAKELIGSRVGTAKAIFSQHSASGQMQTKAAPVKPVRNSIAQRINTINNQQTDEEPEDELPTIATVTDDNIALSSKAVELSKEIEKLSISPIATIKEEIVLNQEIVNDFQNVLKTEATAKAVEDSPEKVCFIAI